MPSKGGKEFVILRNLNRSALGLSCEARIAGYLRPGAANRIREGIQGVTDDAEHLGHAENQ
jgi:hypothetical protein